MRILRVGIFVLIGWASSLGAAARVAQVSDISRVWAGHPVGFDLLSRGQQQFVAFYNAERQMCVASRTLDSEKWTIQKLPTSVVWDSHNYVTMTIDSEGYLHVAGNMHCVPLIYFRSTKPMDVTSLERVAAMVGSEEKRCTYHKFLRGPKEELIFTYRDGRSGSGNQIYNVYDPATKTWQRLLDKPLTDGRGKMNAYFCGPARGPDGMFHLAWVWRNSPDCATNHTLSYMRSRDLRQWESASGKALALPVTIDETSLVVDPVPPGGGIINSNLAVGFDSQKRPIISYHKFDAAGHTQIYNARLEERKWAIHQATKWNYRWEFSGGGSIGGEINVGAVTARPDGTLTQGWSHIKEPSGQWTLDEKTLQPVGRASSERSRPREIEKMESTFPGMRVMWRSDASSAADAKVHYWMRWETLSQNRDRPRPEPWPEASALRVYTIVEE